MHHFWVAKSFGIPMAQWNIYKFAQVWSTEWPEMGPTFKVQFQVVLYRHEAEAKQFAPDSRSNGSAIDGVRSDD